MLNPTVGNFLVLIGNYLPIHETLSSTKKNGIILNFHNFQQTANTDIYPSISMFKTIGGSKEERQGRVPPSGSNLFPFHAVFGNIGQIIG